MLTVPSNLAQDRARELRHEFAESLVHIGDNFWNEDHGKPFARDYYLMALNFEPGNSQARERAGATPGMIAEFRDKAAQGTFSEADLRAAAPLIALAEQDEDKREEKLLALANNADPAPASTNNLDRLLHSTSTPQDPRVRKKNRKGSVPTVGPSVASEVLNVASGDNIPKLDSQPPPVERDRSRSDEFVEEAMAALAAGRRKDAELLLHKALGADNRNASALIGLSDLEFDRGAHARAADDVEVQ